MISVTLKDIVRAAIIVIITLNHLMVLCMFIFNLFNKYVIIRKIMCSITLTPILANIPINPVYLFNPFKKHCEDIYSLKNKDDILYVWLFYRFKMNEKVNKELYNNPPLISCYG